MEIKHIISTMFNVESKDEFKKKRNIKADCTVVNQCDDNSIIPGNVKWINSTTRGLSKSRNIALDNVDSDVVIISDDDIIYYDEYMHIIKKAYTEFPDADAITFLITVSGELNDRVKSNKPILHNKKTILSIGSNEITFKKNSFDRYNIRFNEQFGLGSGRFISGEENLFLKKALDNKLKIYHYPYIIADHPINDLSNNCWDEKMIYTKGAFFYEYTHSKIIAFLFGILFYFIKKQNIMVGISFTNYIKLWRSGIIDGKNYR